MNFSQNYRQFINFDQWLKKNYYEFYNKKHVSSNKTLEFHEKTVIHNLIKVVE